MKRLFLLLAALTISSVPARACTCGDYGVPVCAKYWRSDAVFVGRLSDITLPERVSPPVMPVATLHFIVDQPFRGITTTTVDVETLYGTTCDMPFVKGESYLVYADRDSGTDRLGTGICMGTENVRNAEEDLLYIRSLIQGGVTESINGLLARMRYEPITGAKIEVRNGKKIFEATSDEKGRFSISVNGPGTYTVKVSAPSSESVQPAPGYKVEIVGTATTIEYKVELGKGHCDYHQLDLFGPELRGTAKLAGTVVDMSGRPVRKGSVYLMTGVGYDRFKTAQLDANGSFKFEKIPGDEYLLVLNPDNNAPGENDPPYPRTYYPHAPDSSGAAKIIITEGATLDNLTLRVGPALPARVVSGQVVWEDGIPPAKVYLTLDEGERFVRSIDVDKNGRFSVKVYGDFKYVLEARGSSKDRYGKSDRVAITDKSTNLRLVLKPD